jgi:hypothetical protein
MKTIPGNSCRGYMAATQQAAYRPRFLAIFLDPMWRRTGDALATATSATYLACRARIPLLVELNPVQVAQLVFRC